MYERFFQLRERPFALSPDPEYLYPSRVHQEALSYLRYGVEGHAGFVVITGEIGSGKTTLLQSLLGRLDGGTTVARIVNTLLDARELLEAIALDFDIDPTGLSKPVLIHRLAEFLVRQREGGRLTLLVIDEAQNLGLPALEEIRMLSNLETEKSKLIQIVLVGQPELRDTLARPQLQQLRQRITVSYHLQPLDAADTANYINHRLRRAAQGPPIEFPRDVTALVHQRSRGVPRVINVIADAVLLFAYGLDRREIDLTTVREALQELDANGVLASYHPDGGAPVTAPLPAGTNHIPLIIPTDGEGADRLMHREQEVAAREQQLVERERQMAVQQRVLEEEAKLLAFARAVRAERVATRPEAAAPVGLGVMTAPIGPDTLAPSPSPAPSTSAVPPAAARGGTVGSAPSGLRLQPPRADVRPPRAGLVARLRHVFFGTTDTNA